MDGIGEIVLNEGSLTPLAIPVFVDGGEGLLVREREEPRLHYWNLRTGAFGREGLEGVAADSVLSYSRNGRFLLVHGGENRVSVWDRERGTRTVDCSVTGRFRQGPRFVAFSLSDDGETAITGQGESCSVWTLATGQSVDFDGSGGELSPCGGRVVAGGVAHDVESRRELGRVPMSFCQIAADGSYLHTYGSRARQYDLETGALTESLVAPFEIIGGAVSRDGSRIAAGGIFGGVRVWDVPSEDIVATFPTSDRYNRAVAFSEDASRLVTITDDGFARLWDVDGQRELARFGLFEGGEWISFTPDGYFVGTSGIGSPVTCHVDGEQVGFDRYAGDFGRADRVAASLDGGRRT